MVTNNVIRAGTTVRDCLKEKRRKRRFAAPTLAITLPHCHTTTRSQHDNKGEGKEKGLEREMGKRKSVDLCVFGVARVRSLFVLTRLYV